MYILTIIPSTNTKVFETLTYFSKENVSIGNIVVVKLRGKKIFGLVTDIEPVENLKSVIKNASFSLKPIESVSGNIFTGELYLALIKKVAKYYQISISFATSLLVPIPLLAINEKINESKEKIEEAQKETTIRSEKLIFQSPRSERISYYRTYIRESFARKESVIFVLPTTSDADFWYGELSRGLPEFSFVIHSGKTAKKIETTALSIVSTEHPIIAIMTPSFISIPRKDVGSIIIEEESKGAYKQVREPNIDMVEVVEIYASMKKTRVILGSNLLKIETLIKRENGDYGEIMSPTFRLEGDSEIKMIERGLGESVGAWQMVDEVVLESLKTSLSRGKKIFLFALRNGLATETKCRDCAQAVVCEYCRASLVLYRNLETGKRVFICNRCKHHHPSDTVCTRCGSWNLMTYGIGIDTVYDEAKKQFPDIPIFRIDRESMSTKNDPLKTIEKFEKEKGAILIGTEMALPYIKEKVHESVIVSLDSLWSIPSYRTEERIAHLVTNILGITEKQLFFQTKASVDQGILSYLPEKNLLPWYKEQKEDRRMLGYPPFKKILKYRSKGESGALLFVKNQTEELLKKHSPDIYRIPSSKTKEEILDSIIRVDEDIWKISAGKKENEEQEYLENAFKKIDPHGTLFINPENLLG